jgi:hypothetical protein
MTSPQNIDDSEELEMMLFDRIPSLSPTLRSELAGLMDGGELYNIEMDVLAKAFTLVFGAPVTFEEEGGPGGIISNIVIHWDQGPVVTA